MDDDKFIVTSLKDESSKDIAHALYNKTARQILNRLADKMKSTSQLAKEMKLPLTTIQYNLDLLKKAKLIKTTHYKWSPKGKKVRLYKPAKKIIVLAPEKSAASIVDVLRSNVVLPAAITVTAGVGWILQQIYGGSTGTRSLIEESITKGVPMSAETSGIGAPEATQTVVTETACACASNPIFGWFFAGAFVLGIILFLYVLLRKNS